MNTENFESFSDAEIIRHIATLDLGEQIPDDYLNRLLASITDGSAVVERRKYGYAIILPLQSREVLLDGLHRRAKRVVLEILYVSDEARGTGCGTQFLSELASKYQKFPMYAVCFTKKRCDFFIKRGFVLVENLADDAYQLEFHPQRSNM